MHGGDIATVAVQYSYLQSPLALVLETRTGLNQATALLDVVHTYWRTLPEDRRPALQDQLERLETAADRDLPPDLADWRDDDGR